MNNRDLSPSLNLPNSSSTIWQDPQAHCIFVSDKVSLHSHKIDNICSSLAGAQLASTFTGSHTKRDTASAQYSCEKILNLCPQYQELQLPDSYQYSDNCSTECILSDLPSGICYESQNYGNNSVSLSIEKPSIPCITSQYFKETVEELGPEEVRWLYKIESDKKWTPFIGYDSLRIEWKYRDFLHGSKDVDSSGTPTQEEKIVVRGGLYEVDVQHRSGSSIYWKGETFLIMRGTWFYEGTWMPLDEILADQIEQEHISHFRGHLLSESVNDEAKREILQSITFCEYQVDWFHASDVYLTLDATPSRLMRSVGKKLGFQKTGYKIHRGYSMDASSSEKPPDIMHIVFVIHGIGQKMDIGRIIRNCTSLRENVSWIRQKYFQDFAICSQAVEFFPVEWRSSLTLDGGTIDAITPQRILSIRQMLNASFMDIMYYNSSLYREEIVFSLAAELNRLYAMFTARNPYFEANGGKVSVIAHSLGCVITHDIVTGWSPAPQISPGFLRVLAEIGSYGGDQNNAAVASAISQLLMNHISSRTPPTLQFKIENFFCLGSPLAVFLLLRNKKEEATGSSFGLEKHFKHLFNIFHPSDPVAYRMEPLFCSRFASVSPVQIHCYSSHEAKTPVVGEGFICADYLLPDKEKFLCVGDNNSTPASSLPTTPNKSSGTVGWSLWGFVKGGNVNKNKSYPDPSEENCSADGLCQELPRRLDFILREGSMESSYLSALTSHTAYWTNYDIAAFLVSILYSQTAGNFKAPTCL